MNYPFRRAVVYTGLFALAFSCATPPESPTTETPTGKRPRVTGAKLQPTPVESGPDGKLYEEIRKLYGSQDYTGAIAKSREFESHYAGSPLYSAIENIHGLSLLMSKNAAEAIPHFERAIERNGQNPAANSFLRYNLAKAQYESGKLDDADFTLRQVNIATLDPENATKFHFLKAGVDSRRKLHFEAAREVLLASRLLTRIQDPAETRKSLESYLDQTLQEIPTTPQIEELTKEFSDSPLADRVLYRLAQKEIAAGQSDKAQEHLHQLNTQYPQSQFANQGGTPPATSPVATTGTAPSGPQAPLDPHSIGVLLPTKGKFGQYGIRSLEAIEQAFRIFDARAKDTGYSLVIEDSGEEPDQAVKALDRLVLRHHVAAVIGPLVSKQSDLVARRAEELGVPLISLSRKGGEPGNYVVQGGLTLQLQAYAMARYAIQNRGIQRFAIVFPKEKVGQEMCQYFWDAVESLGGQVTGSESYAPDETDFRQVVDRLSGLYYQDARADEVEQLVRIRTEYKIKKKTRKTEPYFNLRPIVDYQAVFLPDDPKVAGQIMPTFAYRDVDKMQFLGTAGWDSPELIARAQNYAEGALLVDAFYPATTSPRVRRFVENYKATFNDEPGGMEAMAYDAAEVILHALVAAGASYDRAELLGKIKGISGYKGVTGEISYKDGALLRDLKVLTIQGGQIVEAREGLPNSAPPAADEG
jgi:branched-chain amino acid transport system substrate-binding protein